MKQAAASWHGSAKAKRPSLRERIQSRRAAAKPTRSVNHTAKKNSHRRSGIGTRGAFKFLRLGALAAPGIVRAIGPGTTEDKVKMGLRAYTSYNAYTGKCEPAALIEGYGPYVLTSIVTWGIGKLVGMIRRA